MPYRLALLLILATDSLQAEDWKTVSLDGPLGTYSMQLWQRDWPGCEWADGIKAGRISVVKDGDVKALRVQYAAGQIGTDKGGCAWRWPFASKDNPSAELQYYVTFEPGFEFVKGGKLPGLCGGPENISGGKPVTGREGWSARLMWRADGRGQAYVYHMNQPGKWGDEFNFPPDFRFPIGQRVGVRIRVAMNTVGSPDGTLQVWITLPGKDAALLVDHHDMAWRSVPSIGVDSLMFETFHGGSDTSWAPKKDCAARFSQIAVKSGP